MKTRLVSTARVVDNISFNLFSILTLPGTVLEVPFTTVDKFSVTDSVGKVCAPVKVLLRQCLIFVH